MGPGELLILVTKRVGRRDPDDVAGCRAFPVFVDYVGSVFSVRVPGPSPPVPDPSKDETILTVGLHYRPIDQIVIKANFQSLDQGDDVFQFGFGYVF